MRNAWLASRDDGIAATITFVATLVFAPNIQNGLLTGIIFSLGAFIYTRMSPRAVVVALHPDGTLRDAERFKLAPLHREIAALRFDASLFFANVSFFESAILKLERNNRDLKFILIAASGINHLDASAVEMLRALVKRLREVGITLVVSGAKRQVLEVMERTGLLQEIGEANAFSADKLALDALHSRVGNRTVPGEDRPQ